MANRADLATRVGAVLDARQQHGRAGMLALAIAGAAAVVLLIGISPLRLVAAASQAAPAQSVTMPRFETGTIRPVDSNAEGEKLHEGNRCASRRNVFAADREAGCSRNSTLTEIPQRRLTTAFA
jgi:hypothetical protein